MPFLKEQITIINNHLEDNAFNYQQFKSGLIENIAKPCVVADGDGFKIFPAVITVGGTEKYLGLDDTYPLIVYHKILNKSYTIQSANNQYGSGYSRMIENTNAYMVVYAKQSKVGLTAEQLEALIIVNFPDKILASSLSSLNGVETMTVNLTGSDLDAQTVFNAEYQNVSYPLGLEDILIRINYQIEVAYNKSCLNVCEPC